jgi:hypothetical protein
MHYLVKLSRVESSIALDIDLGTLGGYRPQCRSIYYILPSAGKPFDALPPPATLKGVFYSS